MIYLITGIPGHGKSLYGVGMLQRFLKEGRVCYADIDGLQLPGVLPAPDDWRDTPNGAVICYDECQRRFPADGGRGRSDNEQIAAMETHRHTEHDIILITQSPKLLHSHVRRLVGRHHHVERQMGMQYARLYTADRCINTESRGELKAVDSEVWTYPKDDYGKYKSASGHNVKRRVDTRLKWGLATVAVVLALITIGSIRAKSFVTGDYIKDIDRQGEVTDKVSSNAPGIVAEETAIITGCIWTEDRCACYADTGVVVEMSSGQCRKTAEERLPMSITPSGNQHRRRTG